MRKALLIIIAMAWLGLIPTTSFAQVFDYQDEEEEVDYRTEEEKAADAAAEAARAAEDSTKVKIKEPLLSFYFDDSTRLETPFFAWKVNPDYNTVDRVPIDTLLLGAYQVDYPFMAIDGGIGSAFLGNYGSAAIPLNYFSRIEPRNFSFLQVWEPYMMTPEKTMFYNTRLPYSRIDYEMSGSSSIEENIFGVVLSHNVTPSTSVNIAYNGHGTKGMYINQGTYVWNLGLQLAHTGKKWALHGGYIHNRGSITENGGIIDDALITDTLISSANQIDIKLTDAQNFFEEQTIWWTTSYAIPLRALKENEVTLASVPSIFIGNSFNFTNAVKTYTATDEDEVYTQWYLDENSTFDSLSQTTVDTRFFVQIQPYDRNGVVGLISAGVGGEFSTYDQNVPVAYRELLGFGGKMNENSLFVYGDIDGKVSKYVDWNASANFTLLGYRIGDLDIKGNMRLTAFTKKKQQPMSLDASFEFSVKEPDFWEQQYFSNHFIWDNSFSKEISTRLSAKFSIKPINLELGATYEITTNKVYYDSLMNVAQFTDAINNLSVHLKKDFTIGGVHLNNTLLMQLASNEYVTPVPLVSAYLSYFYRLDVVEDVLGVEIGIDGRYQTKYYGFGYNPALAQFYNQREVEVGGFPYLDAFVSAKWKRMRILIKAANWNVNLFGGTNYFMVAHYPQNRMMLKFRFSWSFYD